MPTDPDFPDHPQLEKLRTALWSRREFGTAAVMIGAGFSRNAQRAKAGARAFPVWSDLMGAMVQELYSSDPGPSGGRDVAHIQAQSTSGSLRLAQEYEAAHGRVQLNKFIQAVIPDEDWGPGILHEGLLNLPWADVFTTNYDTLLERAAKTLHSKAYAIVQTTSDIALTGRPRIVKLHGSLPSTLPLIVTEEDFRTYPRNFAPFVNLVQQSMMENLVCLLGFSGDDPNFLHWTGWVRDNLGCSTPPVYLCGLLNLSNAKRKVLDARRVHPIDLSPLFPTSTFPDPGERHRAATTWLVSTLNAGEPPNPFDWPLSRAIKSPITVPNMPAILPGKQQTPRPEPMHP